jgi:hypothetical protein
VRFPLALSEGENCRVGLLEVQCVPGKEFARWVRYPNDDPSNLQVKYKVLWVICSAECDLPPHQAPERIIQRLAFLRPYSGRLICRVIFVLIVQSLQLRHPGADLSV